MINTNNIKFNEEALRKLNSLIKESEVKNASVTSRRPEPTKTR